MLMIDPLVSLTFSIYSNKGGYALLLGSGVSRAAGIPTGWEIVLDLIRKLAKIESEDSEPDPAAWFKKKHGKEPDYSTLLDTIVKTPAERQQLLRSYFEPNEDERSQGLKVPTGAHKSIAHLVVAGYVRVIVTTNFDRLIEKALEEAGIAPTVISSPDQVAGTLPLAHSGVTVIKLHGDYLDTRIKNTPAELGKYDPRLDELLDQVFDEYGLIVCGWFADWDTALRFAIERCPSRRFTTFWATRSTISEHAKRVVEHRRAELIQIKDANQFFESVREKIQALGDLSVSHPLSAKMAVATVKRYIVDESSKIRLHDLIHAETEKIFAELNEKNFPLGSPEPSAVELSNRGRRYEALLETLLPVIISGVRWGDSHHAALWAKAIERIANPANLNREGRFFRKWREFHEYPALLLTYGAGLAAIAAGDYKTLATVLIEPRFFSDSTPKPLLPVFKAHSASYLNEGVGNAREVRLTFYLYEFFRERLRDFLPIDADYRECFDRFEYFFSLTRFELSGQTVWWWGEYSHLDFYVPGEDIQNILDRELEAQGDYCQYLKVGLFGGTVSKMRMLRTKMQEKAKSLWTQ